MGGGEATDEGEGKVEAAELCIGNGCKDEWPTGGGGSKLHLSTGSSAQTASTIRDNIVIEGTGHTGMTIFGGSSHHSAIVFGAANLAERVVNITKQPYGKLPMKDGIIFSPYSALCSSSCGKTRLDHNVPRLSLLPL